MEKRTYVVKKCNIFEQIPDDDPKIKKVHKVNAV